MGMNSGATTLREGSKRGFFLPIAVGGLPAAAVPLRIWIVRKINGPSRLISGRAVLILRMADFKWRSVLGETSRRRDCAAVQFRVEVGMNSLQAAPESCFPAREADSQTMWALKSAP